MNTGAKTLSNNPSELKEIIHQQQHRINQLEDFIRLQKHRQFGASSEKASGQGELFDEVEDLIDTEENEVESEAEHNGVTEADETPLNLKDQVVNHFQQNCLATTLNTTCLSQRKPVIVAVN